MVELTNVDPYYNQSLLTVNNYHCSNKTQFTTIVNHQKMFKQNSSNNFETLLSVNDYCTKGGCNLQNHHEPLWLTIGNYP